MIKEIKIKCCEGNEKNKGECLKNRCPWYTEASEKVQRDWPRTPTGFGNLCGEPDHHDYLSQVKRDIQNEAKRVE